jgi:hypothetical protein
MNDVQESAWNKHIAESIWRKICSYQRLEAGGRDRGASLNPVIGKARRKLLKTERLWALQFDAEVPSFRQARDWPKWETLWVVGRTPSWQAARHENCQRSI